MPYEPTVWKNREVERPRTYTKVENPDGTITLIPQEGNIIEPGTPIIAENMNKIEQGIKEAHELIGDTVSKEEFNEHKANIEELDTRVGPLSSLLTTIKTSIVDAINSLKEEVNEHKAEKAKFQAATGSDTIAITTGGDFALTQGNWIKWIQASANTGAVTINVDAKGAKGLKNPDGTDLVAGDLEAGNPYEAFYSLGDDFFILRPRGAKLDGIITAIESWGGVVEEPKKVDDVITSIQNVASWDADLIPANVKINTEILGIIGQVKEIKYAIGYTSANYSPITVSGLTFRPKLIIANSQSTYKTGFVYCEDIDNIIGYAWKNVGFYDNNASSSTGVTITDTGFTGGNFESAPSVKWFACTYD